MAGRVVGVCEAGVKPGVQEIVAGSGGWRVLREESAHALAELHFKGSLTGYVLFIEHGLILSGFRGPAHQCTS